MYAKDAARYTNTTHHFGPTKSTSAEKCLRLLANLKAANTNAEEKITSKSTC